MLNENRTIYKLINEIKKTFYIGFIRNMDRSRVLVEYVLL